MKLEDAPSWMISAGLHVLVALAAGLVYGEVLVAAESSDFSADFKAPRINVPGPSRLDRARRGHLPGDGQEARWNLSGFRGDVASVEEFGTSGMRPYYGCPHGAPSGCLCPQERQSARRCGRCGLFRFAIGRGCRTGDCRLRVCGSCY